MKKTIRILSFVLCLVMCMNIVSFAANDTKLVVSGNEVAADKLIFKNDSTYLPMEEINAVLGERCSFNAEENTLVVDGNKVEAKDVNGNSTNPFTENGVVYVPVRAAFEACGYTVSWDNTTRSIIANEKESLDSFYKLNTWNFTVHGRMEGQWENKDKPEKAFDDNVKTFYDGQKGGWCGIETKEPLTIKAFSFSPRVDKEQRMPGTQFQVSNDGENYTTIYTVTEPGKYGQFITVFASELDEASAKLLKENKFKFFRFHSGEAENANVSEIRVYVAEDLSDEIAYSDGEFTMTGAELDSMLKSYNKDDVLTSSGLNLPPEKMQSWQDLKFGMFIHWGLYSVLGHGEWAMHNESIPYEEYRKLMDKFNPQSFSGEEWAQLASDAGMRYMVMVARHHDGFSLWDSPSSYDGYDSMRAPANRDFVKEYTEACRAKGMQVGLFYSLMDWRFPGYFDPTGKLKNALEMKEQVYNQVEELMTNYGKIDILWYDGGWLSHKGSDADAAWLWDPIKLNTMVREHQPDIVLNPRSGLKGDFTTREGGGNVTGPILETPWEKCMTAVSGPWGYHPGAKARPSKDIIKIMVDTYTRNGNVLLNVAPDGNGAIPADQQKCLREIGEFMAVNGEAIYGTRGGPVQPVDYVYGTTNKDNNIYVHITDYAKFAELTVPVDYEIITKATMLDGSEVTVEKVEGGIKITVPEEKIAAIDTVVKLEVTTMPEIQK